MKNEDPGRRQDGATKDTGQLICRFLPWAGSVPTSCLLVQATRLARFHGSTGLDPLSFSQPFPSGGSQTGSLQMMLTFIFLSAVGSHLTPFPPWS